MIARTSPIVSLAVRAVTPIALVVAAYVLFAGHNQPGGGFAAGLMLGAIIVLRTVAGLQQPRYASVWMSVGGVIAGLVAIAPMLWGEPLLDQVVVTWDVPVLGTVKSGSALLFDLGVVCIVVGLVIALLDGLGATSLVDRGRIPPSANASSPHCHDARRRRVAVMSIAMIFAVAGLVAAGTFLVTSRSLSRIVLGFALLGHAAVLALLAAGGRAGSPPIVDGEPAADVANPLPQALSLTAIVISFGLTLFVLALGPAPTGPHRRRPRRGRRRRPSYRHHAREPSGVDRRDA